MKTEMEKITGRNNKEALKQAQEEKIGKPKMKYSRKEESLVEWANKKWKNEKIEDLENEKVINLSQKSNQDVELQVIGQEGVIEEVKAIPEKISYNNRTRAMIPAALWKISGSIWYKEDIRKKLLAWGINSHAEMLQEIFPYYLQEKKNYQGIENSKLYEEKEFYFARRLENLIVRLGRILEGKVELKEGESLELLKKKRDHYWRKISQYKGKKSVSKTCSIENLVYEDEQREKILFWKGFTKLSQEKREKFYGKKENKISVKEISSEFLEDRMIEKYAGYIETEEEVDSFSGILAEILEKDEKGIEGGIRYYLRNFSTMKKAKEEFQVYLNEKYQLEESVRIDDRFSNRDERIFFSSDWQRKDEWRRIDVIDEEELILV